MCNLGIPIRPFPTLLLFLQEAQRCTINQTQAATIFSTSEIFQGIIPKLKISNLIIKNYPAIALDLQSVNDTYLAMGHPSISAIIGGDILMKYKAKIEYQKQLLRLYV